MVLTPHQLHRATRRKSSLLRLFIDSYIKKKVLSKIKPHFFGFDFLEMVTNRVALVKIFKSNTRFLGGLSWFFSKLFPVPHDCPVSSC